IVIIQCAPRLGVCVGIDHEVHAFLKFRSRRGQGKGRNEEEQHGVGQAILPAGVLSSAPSRRLESRRQPRLAAPPTAADPHFPSGTNTMRSTRLPSNPSLVHVFPLSCETYSASSWTPAYSRPGLPGSNATLHTEVEG